jgi:hypothetical protein
MRSPIRLAAVALSAALVTSCTTTVPGTPVVTLDTGNYPTTPRHVQAAHAWEAWQQEGWNIADSVVAPWDVDPAFTEPVSPDAAIGPIFNVDTIADLSFLNTQQKESLMYGTFRTGFMATAKTSSTSDKRVLHIGILRFASAAGAARTLDEFVQHSGTQSSTGNAAPGARIFSITDADGTSVYEAATVGNLMILSGVTGAGNHEQAVHLTETATVSQINKSHSYPDTAFTGAIPEVSMDRLGIMSRTLPGRSVADSVQDLSGSFGIGDGYRTIRSDSLVTGGKRFLDMASSHGVEWVGSTSNGSVYRAQSSFGADAFRTAIWGPNGACIVGIPLNRSSCDSIMTDSSPQQRILRCAVSVDNWITVTTSSTRIQMSQACAAQYSILSNEPN